MNIITEQYLNQLQEADAVAKAYKEYMFAAKKKCQSLKGVDKRQCLTKGQIEAKKAQLSRLKKLAGECRTAQDPNKCHRVMMKRAQKINDSVKSLLTKYRENAIRIQRNQMKSEQ